MPIDVLVLGGGSLQAAFEVGAAHRLLETGHRFNLICGTSGGALNALKLAQDAPGSTDHPALAELEQLWRGIEGQSNFAVDQPWFSRLDPLLKRLLSGDMTSLDMTSMAVHAQDWWLHTARNTYLAALGYTEPVIRKLADAHKSFSDLANALAQARSAKGMLDFAPYLTNPNNVSIFDVEHSGTPLLICLTDIETGELRHVNQVGALLDEFALPSFGPQPKIDLLGAAFASASIPGLFSPRTINGRHYSDGGLRANVPITSASLAARRDYGPDIRIFAVLTSMDPVLPPFPRGFDNAGLKEIFSRIPDVFLAGQTAQELRLAEAEWDFPIVRIAPSIPLPSSLIADPGLIDIYMDYGYMRAADILEGQAADTERFLATDSIVRHRLEAWLEETLFNTALLSPVPDVSAEAMRGSKTSVCLSTLSRYDLGGALPPTCSSAWWLNTERHSELLSFTRPFEEVIVTVAGRTVRKIAAAAPPTPRLQAHVEPAQVLLGTVATVRIWAEDPTTRYTLMAGAQPAPLRSPSAVFERKPAPYGQPFQHTFDRQGSVVAGVTAEFYPGASAGVLVAPKPIMITATFDGKPPPFPLNTSGNLLITTTDAGAHPSGTVHVENPAGTSPTAADGSTGADISFTFKQRVHGRPPNLVVVNPVCALTVPGYGKYDVDLGFD
jgi:NTE family protein